MSPIAQSLAIAAAGREQAHIDRRAPVTTVPQLIKAAQKGRRDWRNK